MDVSVIKRLLMDDISDNTILKEIIEKRDDAHSQAVNYQLFSEQLQIK